MSPGRAMLAQYRRLDASYDGGAYGDLPNSRIVRKHAYGESENGRNEMVPGTMKRDCSKSSDQFNSGSHLPPISPPAFGEVDE